MAWNAALASQYGYGRVFREYPQEVLEQQPTRRQLPVFQPPSITFPKLGQWQPDIMDAPEAFAVLTQQPPRRLLPIFQPVGIRFPASWEWLRANYPAIGRLDDVLYQARNWTIPASQPAGVSYPKLGSWPIGIMNPPENRIQWSQLKMNVLPPDLFIGQPAWVWQLDNQAAISRLDQIVYLTFIGFGAKTPPPIYTPQPWEIQQDNFASIHRLDDVLYYARNGALPIGNPAVGLETWTMELANWAALSYKQPIVYLLVQGGGRIPPFVYNPQPWEIEQRNFAAIHRLDPVLYWARNKAMPIGGYEFLSPPWKSELANWAALIGAVPIAIQLAAPNNPLIDAVRFIPAWQFEKDNWASIQYKQQIIYLIRVGLVVLSPFVPPPVQSLFIATTLNWRLFYTEWPQVQLGYRLPNVGILAPTPQPPSPVGEISCYTIEAPPVGIAFLLAESPFATVYMTETGLSVILSGESPHICIG